MNNFSKNKINTNLVEFRNMLFALKTSSLVHFFTTIGCLASESYIFGVDGEKEYRFDVKSGIEQFGIDSVSLNNIDWALNQAKIIKLENINISNIYTCDNNGLGFKVTVDVVGNGQNFANCYFPTDILTDMKANSDWQDTAIVLDTPPVKLEVCFFSTNKSTLLKVQASQCNVDMSYLFEAFIHNCRIDFFKKRKWEANTPLTVDEAKVKSQNGVYQWVIRSCHYNACVGKKSELAMAMMNLRPLFQKMMFNAFSPKFLHDFKKYELQKVDEMMDGFTSYLKNSKMGAFWLYGLKRDNVIGMMNLCNPEIGEADFFNQFN